MDRRKFVKFSTALWAIAGAGALSACNTKNSGVGKMDLDDLEDLQVDDELATGPGMESSWTSALVEADLSVNRALSKARAIGKPLLILLVPEDSFAQWDRGSLFGTLLNRGDETLYRDLALCEVLCALPSDVLAALPGAQLEEGAHMLLVESGRKQARGVTMAGELPELLQQRRGAAGVSAAQETESIRRRFQFLARELHAVIAPEAALLKHRARVCRASLLPVEWDRIRAAALGGELQGIDADRAAAALWWLAYSSELDSDALRLALGKAAIKRLRVAPPEGAKWATSSGCAVDVEGEENEFFLAACGMGHVPEIGRRFLKFYI